mmetsp:Transcript_44777/g.74598  ORF Transcript_44777/g.74598 Transcript_44777/m.74598 type:complete len:213 (+) Transcript_44777:5292-5930(+)
MGLQLLVGEQARHLTATEQAVECLQYGLIHELMVLEEQHRGRALNASSKHHCLQVRPERFGIVISGHAWREEVHAQHIGDEGDGCTAANTIATSEQHGSSGLRQHSVKAHNVVEDFGEQEHVQLLGHTLVGHQPLLNHKLKVLSSHSVQHAHALTRTWHTANSCEIDVAEVGNHLPVFSQHAIGKAIKPRLAISANESVSEYSRRLVSPSFQ